MRKDDPPPLPLLDALFLMTIREGTRLMELALAVSLLSDGFLVLMSQHGVNAVPFLSSSLSSLAWPGWIWSLILILLGLVTLRGWYCSQTMVWGRIRRREPALTRQQEILLEPLLLWRAGFLSLQTVMWAIITAAVATGPPPLLGCLRYGRALFFAATCTLMLWEQWDYARKRREHDVEHDPAKGGVDAQR